MLEGAFRIVVAPGVVAAAQGEDDVEWGSVTVTGMWVHDEPAIDAKSWIGWNLRTIGDVNDSERRMMLFDGKLGNHGGTGLSAGLNNSITDDIAGDWSEYDDINPAIQSPTFGEYTAAGGVARTAAIGQVRFRARLYETNAVAAAAKPATLTLYGTSDGSGDSWTVLTNYTVESTVYRIFSYSAPSDRFRAMRFVIDGVTGGSYAGGRVLLDEIVVSERPEATVSFVYARPFRTGLAADKVVGNVLSPDQQPLTDESWGVQAKLKFDATGGDIDVEKGFKVFFRYFVGEKPWGHDGGWESESAASDWAELVQVGAAGDWTFRSTISNPKTVVSTVGETTTVVQYMLKVRYWVSGADGPSEETIKAGTIDDMEDGDGWTNPSWYSPIDYNADSLHGAGTAFSPYTILDPVSPRRVWINEVSYNDGPKASRSLATASRRRRAPRTAAATTTSSLYRARTPR